MQCSGYSANVVLISFCDYVFHAIECVFVRSSVSRIARNSSSIYISLSQQLRVVITIHNGAHLIAQPCLLNVVCWAYIYIYIYIYISAVAAALHSYIKMTIEQI